MTPEERVEIWLRNDAADIGIPPHEVDEYVAGMRGTMTGELMRLGYATDDLAASNLLGKVMAIVFFGWRPEHRDHRASLLEPRTRE